MARANECPRQDYMDRISRVLARHNIKSVGLPHMKLSSLLRPVRDHLGLRTPGVYRIHCECGRVYTGQTGRSVDIRLMEHQRHIRLEHPDKSAVAEHRDTTFNSTMLPSSPRKPDIWTAMAGWALWRRGNVSPVRYDLGSCIPVDDFLHSHRRETLKYSSE
jgi:hypothetical protein